MSGNDPAPPPKPLSPQERELLRERSSDGASKNLTLQGRFVDRLTVRDLDWTGCSWRRLHAEHVTFANCRLTGVDFAGAVLRDVSFQDCTLVECRFDKCRLERVRVAGGALQGGWVRQARMQNCSLERVDVVGVLFDTTQIVDIHVERGKLSQVHFSECTLGRAEFGDAAISALQLTLCRGEQLHLRGCEVADVAVLGGRWARIELLGGTFGELALAEVGAQTVLIDGATSSDRLNLNDCQIEQLSVARCPELRDLYLFAWMEWFYSVFTPFTDFSVQLPKQQLVCLGWGNDEDMLGGDQGPGYGLSHLPRPNEVMSPVQLRLLHAACAKHAQRKVVVLSHFTVASFDDSIALVDGSGKPRGAAAHRPSATTSAQGIFGRRCA